MATLTSKIVLVTGAAGAIGSAVCAAVTRGGGTAIATDLKAGGAIAYALDVTAEKDWSRVMADIERAHGRLDGLVNAAGIVALGTVEQLDFATWRRVLSINLDGAFLGCKYAMPLLRKQGGAIVNLSSVSGLVGGHNLAAYNASKGGLSLLSKSVALHGARLKPPVRCNAICPAFVEGPMIEQIAQSARNPDLAREKMPQEIPLGRVAKPGEIAALCAYLLSDEAAFITGADVPIDGGLTAR
ncbi:MAG: Oxidoreductase, short-chain dehydrogenase/reductase family [Pseudolabrys sp.]|jgi:NAD(P)-dependent dehydrogenase (short-subunit alcohol dehydrogenase family)|nr:Oxidoreductase, short-chain dehydrogenase/reductase family [Pseudolabrys sp.]